MMRSSSYYLFIHIFPKLFEAFKAAYDYLRVFPGGQTEPGAQELEQDLEQPQIACEETAKENKKLREAMAEMHQIDLKDKKLIEDLADRLQKLENMILFRQWEKSPDGKCKPTGFITVKEEAERKKKIVESQQES